MQIQSRSGLALPVVLLTLVLLTVGLVALFTLVGSDRRVTDNESASMRAFELAESGLEQFIAKRDSMSVYVADSAKWKMGYAMLPPARSESLRITVAGGYADVIVQRIRVGGGNTPSVYVVRSHGVSTVGRLRGVPQAERTVAQFAYWQLNPIRVIAGWTAVTGLNKNGNSGSLSGTDGCGVNPAVAGVAVGSPGYTGQFGPASGNPPIQSLGTQQQAYVSAGIDWNAIVNENAIMPDITLPGGSWPNFSNPNYWPVIRANGNFSLPGDGRGTLIVTGNLTISGSTSWNGVILVGGNLTSNGNNTVQGAVVSGLNVGLGQTVPQGTVGNGNKTYQYNSCNIANAAARFAALRVFPNAWLDNWATY